VRRGLVADAQPTEGRRIPRSHAKPQSSTQTCQTDEKTKKKKKRQIEKILCNNTKQIFGTKFHAHCFHLQTCLFLSSKLIVGRASSNSTRTQSMALASHANINGDTFV
jgi:hypothetical protein